MIGSYGDPIVRGLAYPEGIDAIPGLGGWIARLLHWIVTGHEMLMGYNLGARQMRPTRALVGVPFMLLVTFLAFNLDGRQGGEMLAITLMLLVAFWHRSSEAWDNLLHGNQERHTFFMGYSVLLYLAPILPQTLRTALENHWLMVRFVHPALAFGLGLLVAATRGSPVVAGWLILGSLAMFAKNMMLYTHMVDHILNQYDSALSRFAFPRHLENLAAGTGPGPQTVGMPVSSAMLNVLQNIPAADMDAVVKRAMGNGAGGHDLVQQELPHA